MSSCKLHNYIKFKIRQTSSSLASVGSANHLRLREWSILSVQVLNKTLRAFFWFILPYFHLDPLTSIIALVLGIEHQYYVKITWNNSLNLQQQWSTILFQAHFTVFVFQLDIRFSRKLASKKLPLRETLRPPYKLFLRIKNCT